MFSSASRAALPGQPFASYWHPNTLLSWNPTNDPDAAFNRASVPIAARFLNPALNVNAHARLNQGKVASLSAFAPTSGNPSQGGLSMNYYAHTFWQYEDVLVFWGGSASEGIILAPNPTVIDAAHRNGVLVLGNVFFPPTAYGGQIGWVNEFLQKSGSTFPIADKLIQVAQYYGFDGWFLNQETAGGNSTTATTMRDFIKYMRTNSTLHIQWYDAMTESGSVSWQNQLSSANDMFFHDGGRVSDSMFLNFWWSSAGLASSRTRAQSFGRSEFDLYAGIDVEGGGYNTSVSWTSMFPEGQSHVLSLGLYRPDWCYNGASGVTDFHARESRFWVGPFGDPSTTSSTNAWPGIAHFIPAKSAVTKLPFVTSFNTGQGNRYLINGQAQTTLNWNNLSLQDVLPTWRWLVSSTGSRLTPTLDNSDAYYGGTSLRVSGVIDATNTIQLFQTSLAISNDTTVRLAYKTGTAGAATYMKLALAFEDSPGTYHLFDVVNTTSSGWNLQTLSLSSFAGRKLALISLRFGAPSVVNSYNLRVGQIAIRNGTVSTPPPPTGIVVDRVSMVDATTATVRLKWNHSTSPVNHYNVYRRNADNSRTWLGATPNNAYFVPQVKRVAGETYIPVEIETVAPDLGVSTATSVNVPWPATLVNAGSVWRYNDTGANLGTAWRASSYNDSAWPSGPAMLGYGDADGQFPATTNSYGPDSNNKYITTYYRHRFLVEDPGAYKGLTLSVQRDDGALVYLNGVEVFRSNMPEGAVTHLTPALGAAAGGDEAAFYSVNLPNSALLAGTNVLAVEVHQNNNTSSDLAFDLALAGVLNALPTAAFSTPANGMTLTTNVLVISASAADLDGVIQRLELLANGSVIAETTNTTISYTWTNIPVGAHILSARAVDDNGGSGSTNITVIRPGLASVSTTFIPAGAAWRYFDRTNDLPAAWRGTAFDDSTWSSGTAELGFGDASDGRPESTVISNRNQITFYFRRPFYIADPTMIATLNARLVRDDGAVVYLNGTEVWRDNLPAGTITSTTAALTSIGGGDESAWLTRALSRSSLIPGTNVLAVEVHQQSSTSSDLSFNFELTGSVIIPSQPALDLQSNSGQLVFTWPGDQGVFSLYMATNLPASSWVRVTNAPVLVDGQWTVTLPQTNAPQRYYRVRWP